MGKRGPKPKGIVQIKWTSDFAYAIGLLASDGCLSSDGRHITLTSKDEQQIRNFQKCLGLDHKIGKTFSGHNKQSYYRVQFGDILFYQFLLSIGLTPAKSKIMGELAVPKELFFDFLRGVFDGDGYTYSYWDKRWKSSFMFYFGIVSASHDFLNWIRRELKYSLGVEGHITKDTNRTIRQLKYAKAESLLILRKLYPTKKEVCLKRKYLKIQKMMAIVGKPI